MNIISNEAKNNLSPRKTTFSNNTNGRTICGHKAINICTELLKSGTSKKTTSDRAARSKMRLESDLEPGNLTMPEISRMGCSTISGTVDGFSAVATEAKTIN
ncbi:ubiquitin conjugating enzyme 8 [Striga asiatica]|uniref:Ubiquitin conjugating enzyme 8 n=1 Tax=Striga asiatica TaxID=4170 RepID=A0A5A7RK16_STRAF|nr:ubiquitin conjugating enzyme 8 [Striga asiatica]